MPNDATGSPAAGSPEAAAPAPAVTAQAEISSQALFSRHAPADAESLHLIRGMQILRRHLVSIIFIAMALPAVVYLYDAHLYGWLNREFIPARLRLGARPVYSAQATLVRPRVPITNLMRDMRFSWDMDLNLRQALGRKELQEAFVAALQRDQDYAGEMQARIDEHVKTLGSSGFGARLSGETEEGIYVFSFEGVDAELLPMLARSVAPALNDHAQQVWLQGLDAAQGELNRITEKAESALEEVWDKLNAIDEKLPGAESIHKIEELDPETRERIGQAREMLSSMRREAYALEVQCEKLRLQLDRYKEKAGYQQLCEQFGISEAGDIDIVLGLGDERRMKWAALEQELAGLKRRYRLAHPRIQAILRQIKALKEELEQDGKPTKSGKIPPLPDQSQILVLNKIRTMTDELTLNSVSLEIAQANIERQKRGLDEILGKTRTVTPEEQPKPDKKLLRQRSQLQIEQRHLEQRIFTVLEKTVEIDIARKQLEQRTAFEQVSCSERSVQIRPKTGVDVAVAVILGVLLGCAVAFMRNAVSTYFYTPADIYYHLGVNYLGVIPRWRETQHLLINPEEPISPTAEVFSCLCNNIRYGRTGDPQRRFLIVSALPGEGKSTIAVNLALRYAQEGQRVAFIDADMRRPRGHKLMGIFAADGGSPTGLTSYLGGEAELGEVLHETHVPGLTILPAGSQIRNPVRLLNSDALPRLLDRLEEQFDIVIVDGPAILPVVDATLLAPHMRGVVMVIAAEDTEVGAVRMGLYRLRHVGAPIAGAILNKAREGASGYAYYGRRYGRRYLATYGYGMDSEPQAQDNR